MPLNISQGGGDYLPYVKFNSKAGRWYVKKDDKETEVTNPVFVADFANIKTGWYFYAEGQAPNIVLDASLTDPAPKPTDKHKRGFTIHLFSQKQFGGVVELNGASMHLCNSIAEVYGEYEKDSPANAGKLPVVSCTGTLPMKDKMGTNYKPVFKIEKWVDRPSEFDDAAGDDIPFDAPENISTESEF